MHRRGRLMDDPYIDNTTDRSMDEQTRKALELAREALMSQRIHVGASAIIAIDAALSAPAAPVALTDDDLWRLWNDLASDDMSQQEATAFANSVIAEFCRVNGIGQPAAPAAQVARPLAGLISRASMVLKPSAGHEVTFRFDDLEDATRMRLWAESRVAQVAATAAPVAHDPDPMPGWIASLPTERAPAAPVAQPLVESVINAARAAMDESTEAYDADMSIKIPSHLAASLSLCLDEYDRAHDIGQGDAA